MKRIMLCLTAAMTVLGIAGCRKDDEPVMTNINEEMPGGTIDYSRVDAPAAIESADLKSFSSSFFVWDDYSYEGSWYYYSLKEEDGKLMLEEDRAYGIRTEADPLLLKEVHKIIEKHNLARLNGTSRYTSGLPAEYQPCFLSARYASGEELYFSVNNDPEAQWAKDLKKLFNRTFASAGFEETAENPDHYVIDHFSLEFRQGDQLMYRYGTIIMQSGRVNLYRQIYDYETEQEISFEFADMENGFNEQFSALIEELDLQRLHSIYHKDPDHHQDFLEIHIDYISSRQIYGEYGADEIPEAWLETKDRLKSFLDGYMEENLIPDEE